jgi:hypothetical protein
MAFGEMAGILFDSCAAATDRLRNTGFRCTSESLDPALHALLNV